jgi:hypothetical protein
MKCLALAWTLSAVGMAAPGHGLPSSQARELDSDDRIRRVRELLRSSRQLQGEDCLKTSKALESANNKLADQYSAAFDRCTTIPCTVDIKSLAAYSSYRSACSAAKGALATYKMTHSCPGLSAVLVSVPICLVSKKTNKNCGPKLFGDFLELASAGGCTTIINTGYTDFFGSKPVKKPVKRPVRRRALA